MITDGQARRIASEWHGGQASALYSLASTGAIAYTHVRLELAVNLVHIDRMIGESAKEYMREIHMDQRRELLALDSYIQTHGSRDKIDGWSDLWDDSPVELELA